MDRAQLDDHEITILRFLAQGMTASDIAAAAGVSPRQMQRRVQALRDRLGAATNIQAVTIAVRRSVI
ncbi:LuxR C-terminal-related transcriptional regulator [Nocardioides xinjiangensis]|uniref:LuxR C-terminal-related transcriptional regulator n=1 Tax=Nocardioides xinjiangensis TaxID=2817376 RepID=UPI001B318770|nr:MULTISPECIES: LuxR C-terminal-related transcriptional regulator [unclassified Nocardioides]